MKHLVFFDLETSGFDPLVNDIIQIAAIATDQDLNIVEEFEVKIDFDPQNAEAEALEVNSFDAAVWKSEAVKPYKALSMFCSFLDKYKSVKKISKRTGNTYSVAQLVGHNSEGFDRDFLFKWGKRINPNQFIPAEWFTLDTMQIQKTIDALYALNSNSPNFASKSLKLGDLVTFDGAHDALADVKATIDLFAAQRQLLKVKPL